MIPGRWGQDTGPNFRRTDAPQARTGGIYQDENGQQTFTDGRGNKTWFVDTTSTAISITLPNAEDVAPDTLLTVIRKTAGANALTVTPGTGTINGAASHSISTQYMAYTYASDGTNYYIVSGSP